MWATVAKIFAYFDRFQAVAVVHPVLSALLVILTIGPAILSVLSLRRGRPKAALWWAIVVVVVGVALSRGDDSYTHVYRIVALSEQLRQGAPSLLLTNVLSGIALPTFLYYSALPYVLPVALNLLGLPALFAFDIASALMFVVMGFGLQSLIEKLDPPSGGGSKGTAGFLAALMFVAANYVYALWTMRASLGEFWVYALIPWAVNCALSARPARGLILVFFLQACSHPIVMAHSLLCEVPVVIGLARIGPVEATRRLLPPLVAAVVIAVPFWLPQALTQGLILGPAALPADFKDSFLPVLEFFDPKSNRNTGPWIPFAILAMIVVARGALTRATWFLVASFAVLVALQSVYLERITIHIPTLELSLFVWRLMMPAAFLGFAALVSGWGEIMPDRRLTLVVFAGMSVICMAILITLSGADYLPKVAAAEPDHEERVAFDRDKENSIWGIREYLPNTSRLPQTCPAAGDMAIATFGDLKAGVRADKPYIAIVSGPVGIVDYSVDGRALQPAACARNTVLGPVEPGATVRVSEAKLEWLLVVRGIEMFGVAILLAFLGYRRTFSRA
jgi:hypothetical protein